MPKLSVPVGTVVKPVKTVSVSLHFVSNNKPVKTVKVDPGCCLGKSKK
jgi:hypothetical protein